MNKYWIHEPTGNKAVVIKDEKPNAIKMSWKGNEGFSYQIVTKDVLDKFYIPITKAEYDSSLTLKEIERNRSLFNNLVENDEIICKSNCKSNCDTDLDDGEVYRVKAKGENIVILYGLIGPGKGLMLAVEEDTINAHFVFYNTEDRTEECIHNEKKEDMKDTFESLCQEMIDVHKAKNHDYGDSFHNLFKELGINYAYGHLREKLERIKTLKDNEAKVKSESMIDSLKDLANYAIMTIIELQNGKKN